MNDRYEIVWLSPSNPADYHRYNYALCKCCVLPEAIRFPKAHIPTFHRFPCPRCGEPIGYVESMTEE